MTITEIEKTSFYAYVKEYYGEGGIIKFDIPFKEEEISKGIFIYLSMFNGDSKTTLYDFPSDLKDCDTFHREIMRDFILILRGEIECLEWFNLDRAKSILELVENQKIKEIK